jgi:hypothetical protein
VHRVAPAHQRLEAEHGTVGQVDERLVADPQPLVPQGLAQVLADGQGLVGDRDQLGAADLDAVAAQPPRLTDGEPGAAEQVRGGGTGVEGVAGDEAAAHRELHAALAGQHDGRRHGGGDAVGQVERHGRCGEVGEEHAELVVGHPGQHAERADLTGHPGGEQPDQLVGGGVVLGGGRLGDPLDVDQQDRGTAGRPGAGRTAQRLGHQVHERGVRHQSGDLVAGGPP